MFALIRNNSVFFPGCDPISAGEKNIFVWAGTGDVKICITKDTKCETQIHFMVVI